MRAGCARLCQVRESEQLRGGGDLLQRARRRIDPVLVIMLAVIALAMLAAFVCRIDSVTQLTAGTTGLPPTDIRVAVVTHGGVGDPFWDQVAAGAHAAQREFGLEVRFDGSGDVQEQIRLVDNAVSQSYDVIVVSLADPDAMEDSIRGAVAAGITVFSINSGEERGREFGAITHFGQPDGVAGLAAGERLVAAGVTRLLCIIHEPNNVGLVSRCENATLAMELAGGTVELLTTDARQDVIGTGTAVKIQTVLQSDSTIDGVLALNSGVAEEAMDAIRDARSTALLATFDVSDEVLAAIEAGEILFAVDQQAYLQGFLPVAYAYFRAVAPDEETGGIIQALLRWGAFGRLVTGPGFVDAENVRRYPQLEVIP